MKPDLAVCLTYNKAVLVWQHSSNFSLTKTLTTASASKERIRPELSDVQVTYLSRNAQASSRLKLELDSSIELLEAGTTELETGTTELETGASELDAGTSELEAGTTELETGASELLDFALEEETDELVPPCPEEDDLAELLDLASLELDFSELLDLASPEEDFTEELDSPAPCSEDDDFTELLDSSSFFLREIVASVSPLQSRRTDSSSLAILQSFTSALVMAPTESPSQRISATESPLNSTPALTDSSPQASVFHFFSSQTLTSSSTTKINPSDLEVHLAKSSAETSKLPIFLTLSAGAKELSSSPHDTKTAMPVATNAGNKYFFFIFSPFTFIQENKKIIQLPYKFSIRNHTKSLIPGSRNPECGPGTRSIRRKRHGRNPRKSRTRRERRLPSIAPQSCRRRQAEQRGLRLRQARAPGT